MRQTQMRAWLLASALALCGGVAFSAVPTAEDLTGCKLPNGRAVLPVMGTQAANAGTLYKFSTQTMGAIPAMEDHTPLPAEQVVAKVQEGKLGDLQYVLDGKGNGTLWAMSGQIMELPRALFLADATGKKNDEPMAIPKTSRNLPGQISDGKKDD